MTEKAAGDSTRRFKLHIVCFLKLQSCQLAVAANLLHQNGTCGIAISGQKIFVKACDADGSLISPGLAVFLEMQEGYLLKCVVNQGE